MIRALSQLGASIERRGEQIRVRGTGGELHIPDDVINCGNSGLVLRFVGALAGRLSGYTLLTGDASIRSQRSAQPLLDGLTQLGAWAISTRSNGKAPLAIRGPWAGQKATIEGSDSQPVSGLLIAGAWSPYPLELTVLNPGETPWVDLTLDWLRRLQIPFEAKGHTHYRVEGGADIPGFCYRVPGDFSSAAFPIAAALVTRSRLTVENLDFADPQGDRYVLEILQQMGACFTLDPERGRVEINSSGELCGATIDCNRCIDALPILSVIACFARGTTKIVNAAIARGKESDRIRAMTCELKKMGAHIEELHDGLIVEGGFPLQGASVDSHADHRVAMSLAVAALGARGTTWIQRIDCIRKTYPAFANDLSRVGARLWE
jgi:3-phosphoshikimate 1-carboxyvinyltransferase